MNARAGRTVAIVGATGLVGRELVSVVMERGLVAGPPLLFASGQSAGVQLGSTEVRAIDSDSFVGVDIAFFATPEEVSLQYSHLAREAGALVIDNSNAYREDLAVPLVVPEVNGEAVKGHEGLISNPNCSTILLAVVLSPLRALAPIRRVCVATYQAISGAGRRAVEEFERQMSQEDAAHDETQYGAFAFNVIPWIGSAGKDDSSGEETKMRYELRRLLDQPELEVLATCVRVPVRRAHSEAVWVDFDSDISVEEARRCLSDALGVRVVDDSEKGVVPTPRMATGGDEVLVGRIRQEVGHSRGLSLFLTGDQLRKGAALNAVQVAELAHA